MSPKGYVIVEAKVHDIETYERYKLLSLAAIEQYAGRFIIREGGAEVLEGKWSPPQQLAIIEFESVDQAKRFYHSPAYQAAKTARENAADINMLVTAGVDNLL